MPPLRGRKGRGLKGERRKMCGIGGFKRFGAELPNKGQVSAMLYKLSRRGLGATGVAIQHKNGAIYVHKEDCPAWKFTASDEYDNFMKKYLNENVLHILCHTRQPTKGTVLDMNNNHPCFIGKTAIVHNGMIHNDDQLFRETKLPRCGEVDSDIIRALLDDAGLGKKGIAALGKMRGQAAIAAISTYPTERGKLLLVRSGNPIVLASTKQMLVWASEKDAIHLAMRPYVERFGIVFQPNRPDLGFINMADKSAWLIGEGGLEWRDGFDLQSGYTAPNYNCNNDYDTRVKARFYAGRLPAFVICGNPECKITNKIPEAIKDEPLWKLKCAKCRKPLAGLEEVEEVASS